MRSVGKSETTRLKQEIQKLVRAIVIIRDGGCILRDCKEAPRCAGFNKKGELILQADHLITRSNSATYDDTRLIVCVCKGHHGWKHWHQKQYEDVVRSLLPEERVVLWDDAEKDSWKPTHRVSADWRMSIVVLCEELARLKRENQ